MALGTRSLVSLDLFTDAYRVTGSATVGAGGIHAELANPNSSFLEIQGAYVSRINEPGEIVTQYDLAAFRKDNINFIVLQDRRVGIPVGTQHGRSIFTRGQAMPVFLTVPSFEIKGEITHTGKPNPRDILAKAVGGYVLVFGAKAFASLYPKIAYSGDLIMISRDRIGLFCLDANKS
ncbi:MAG: hypothetical protein GY803_20930 [Chloroflexi bacterium]|nr:hypothetical protein [Chloroflexota bacterium]